MFQTDIFANHKLTSEQTQLLRYYTRYCNASDVAPNHLISISTFGQPQSGKTSATLCFGLCPFTNLPPSKKPSSLQSVFVEPTTKQKYRVLITDSGDFVLSTAVVLCVPASDEL